MRLQAVLAQAPCLAARLQEVLEACPAQATAVIDRIARACIIMRSALCFQWRCERPGQAVISPNTGIDGDQWQPLLDGYQ